MRATLLAVLLAATAAAATAATAPPAYPGATPGTVPAGITPKAPPPQTKAYSTPDSFAKVKAWYQAHLKGAMEMAQPGQEKFEDAFLVGQGATGMVVMVKSFKGQTWILIGPPV